ncbi:MAG: hypothetical protein IH988_00415 [Planctomycetes bacterium]|nr:hypothetical protein [Planctomycetota bacterium]
MKAYEEAFGKSTVNWGQRKTKEQQQRLVGYLIGAELRKLRDSPIVEFEGFRHGRATGFIWIAGRLLSLVCGWNEARTKAIHALERLCLQRPLKAEFGGWIQDATDTDAQPIGP